MYSMHSSSDSSSSWHSRHTATGNPCRFLCGSTWLHMQVQKTAPEPGKWLEIEFNMAEHPMVIWCAGHGQTPVVTSTLPCYWPLLSLFSQFLHTFPSLFHLNPSLSPTLGLSLNTHPLQPHNDQPGIPAGSTPSPHRVTQGAAPVDPSGGWHPWATELTAHCDGLGRRRVRGPSALTRLSGSLTPSLFYFPL